MVNAFTLTFDAIPDGIVTDVNIAPAGARAVEAVTAPALWDTGSPFCCISPGLAQALGLVPTHQKYVVFMGAVQLSKTYLIDLYLPGNNVVASVPAYELDNHQVFSVIIGMSIIALGDMAISNFQGKTVFSFRLPSAGTIDFVDQVETGGHDRGHQRSA